MENLINLTVSMGGAILYQVPVRPEYLTCLWWKMNEYYEQILINVSSTK